MSENKLNLDIRTATGKKVAAVRENGFIPSVIYGENKEPILAQSEYNPTEKALREAGYHSTIDLTVDGKKKLAIVKNISVNPVSGRIINIEFQAVSANEAITAVTPIVLVGFDGSQAAVKHYALTQTMEEIEVKAKPSDLPEKLEINVADLNELDDKITVADIKLPKGVELADKELDHEQVVASLYDPAAEAAKQEAADAASETTTAAADVPSDNGAKPEEPAKEEKK